MVKRENQNDETDEKFPKKFRNIMILKNRLNNKSTEKGKEKEKTIPNPKPVHKPIQPNESMKDFCQRIDSETRTILNQKHQKQTKTKQKRQLATQTHKKKMKLAGKKDIDQDTVEERIKNRDKVQFGERVEAPPTITILPKLRKPSQTVQDPVKKVLRDSVIQEYRLLKARKAMAGYEMK